MSARAPDVAYLLSTLSSLRVALPSMLVAILALRVLVRSFLAMMDRVQSQGWTQVADEDEDAPIRGDAPAEDDTADDDAIRPVVVQVREVRTGLVLGLFAIVAGTYFLDGAAQGQLILLGAETGRS